jgi:hypothetical protein
MMCQVGSQVRLKRLLRSLASLALWGRPHILFVRSERLTLWTTWFYVSQGYEIWRLDSLICMARTIHGLVLSWLHHGIADGGIKCSK